MSELEQNPGVLALIDAAVNEDLGPGDVTSNAIFGEGDAARARIVAKAAGVLCGAWIVRAVYGRIDPAVGVSILMEEGARLVPGNVVVSLEGPVKSILGGERIALNFFQRMSGIATKTASLCALIGDGALRVLDTRKTLPGFRLLDKYSVKTGGGTNHRMGLYDMVMIKDNHIRAAGGIRQAMEKVRAAYGTAYRTEIEATTLDEVQEAMDSGADSIMLDNMDIPAMKRAVALVAGRAKIEISGNVDETSIVRLKDVGADFVSIGALTHSVAAFDFSMKFD
ncbi:MAG: carboxylating nicotinate-nucleotide diphosphorylase [Spirochaetes bacterium]|nr:MAG: carboxylating nicotinate-nucleotide diphosphorylase [Spirochaetota bacterium]